jgi:hypothetical protein
MTETREWNDRRQQEIQSVFDRLGIAAQGQRGSQWEAGHPVEPRPSVEYTAHLSNSSETASK